MAGARNEIAQSSEDPQTVRVTEALLGMVAGNADDSPALPQYLFGIQTQEDVASLHAGLASLGEGAAVALLDVMEQDWSTPATVSFTLHANSDESRAALETFLRENATAELDRRLIAHLLDNNTAPRLRLASVIALSRPGTTATQRALLDFALDRTQATALRSAVLHRLPRLGIPAPRELRELLWMPFYGRVDHDAAATLALMGDPEAPSLLAEGLENTASSPDPDRVTNLIRAVMWVMGQDAARIKADARVVLSHAQRFGRVQKGREDGRDPHRVEREARMHVSKRFREWLEEHPEARDTHFEQRRSAQLNSRQYIRSVQPVTFDEAMKLPDAERDLAATLMSRQQRRFVPTLADERVARVCDYVSRELAVAQGAKARMDRFIDLMLTLPPPLLYGSVRAKPPGATDTTIQIQHNRDLAESLVLGPSVCLSSTTLVLAVADRLDLPVRAVASPGHVFARWEEGDIRRNIECTENGKQHPDEHYLKLDERNTIAKRALTEGRFFRSMTESEFIALVLTNDAAAQINAGKYEKGIETVRRAMKFDPSSPMAQVTLAWGASGLDPVDTKTVVAAAKAATASGALSAGETVMLAESLTRADEQAKARAVRERYLAEHPECVLVRSAARDREFVK